jgi:[ribosomal protein S18]-alanine N-acetyltransferase
MTVVRAATMADLDALSSLERATFDLSAWSPRLVENELQETGDCRQVLVADRAGEVVGYAVSSVAGDTCDVRRLAVAESWRRRGVAAGLMADLLAQPRRQHCERAVLEVAAGNTGALAFYRELGFVEIARRRGYYDDDDAVVMALGLRREPR